MLVQLIHPQVHLWRPLWLLVEVVQLSFCLRQFAVHLLLHLLELLLLLLLWRERHGSRMALLIHPSTGLELRIVGRLYSSGRTDVRSRTAMAHLPLLCRYLLHLLLMLLLSTGHGVCRRC